MKQLQDAYLIQLANRSKAQDAMDKETYWEADSNMDEISFKMIKKYGMIRYMQFVNNIGS